MENSLSSHESAKLKQMAFHVYLDVLLKTYFNLIETHEATDVNLGNAVA
jgi:hypothetical protein